MSDILLLLKRTVFLPKGSPGIFSINDIKVDIRNPEIKGDNGKIYCLGDCDILLEYLSQDTEKDLKRGIMLAEDAISKNSEPRPWQALISLPFALAEEGEMVCPPLSQVEVTDVKWFVVAPRALELEVSIKLLADKGELKAAEETGETALSESIDQEIRAKAPLNTYEEIYMEDQIYIGLDDCEKYQELADNEDEIDTDALGSIMTMSDGYEEEQDGEEVLLEKMMKETGYSEQDELTDIEFYEEILETEVGFKEADEEEILELEIMDSKEDNRNAEEILLFKDKLGIDFSSSQRKINEKQSGVPQDVEHIENEELKAGQSILIKKETSPLERSAAKEREIKSTNEGLKSNQFNMRLCRVLDGDDLESIALRMNVSVKSLASRNKISDADLKAGMYLIIPR